MQNRGIVIGLGETGLPLWQILDQAYPGEVKCYDAKRDDLAVNLESTYSQLHICLPYNELFLDTVRVYQDRLRPTLTVIHSTVPVGTTSQVKDAVHSPILGKHGRMKDDILTYTKWVGGERAGEAADFFRWARIRTYTVKTPEQTELFKLLCLAKYGTAIAFSIYQKTLCDKFNIPYQDVYNWDANYNEGVLPSLKRPIIDPPFNGKIGGHCVVPGARLLNSQFPSQMLEEVIKHG